MARQRLRGEGTPHGTMGDPMCLLSIDQQCIIQRAKNDPGSVEHQIRQAQKIINVAKKGGRFDPCVNGADRIVRLTEALWDYFRDRESVWR